MRDFEESLTGEAVPKVGFGRPLLFRGQLVLLKISQNFGKAAAIHVSSQSQAADQFIAQKSQLMRQLDPCPVGP